MSEHRAREECRRGEALLPAPAAHQRFRASAGALQLWAVLDAHLLCAAAGLEGWIIDGVSVQLPQSDVLRPVTEEQAVTRPSIQT